MSNDRLEAGKLFARSKYKMTMQPMNRGEKTGKATIELFYHGISMGVVKGVVHEQKTK